MAIKNYGTGWPIGRFPRWRVWNRHVANVEAALSSVWLVITTPVVGAVLAAAFAATASTREAVRNGVVVGQTSLGHALIFAAIGGGGGILVVLIILGLRSFLSYQIRGDRNWRVRWALVDDGFQSRKNEVALTRKHQSVRIEDLGIIEAATRFPDGDVRAIKQKEMLHNAYEIGFLPVGSIYIPFPRGIYQVRWYGTTPRGRSYEIARSEQTLE